jgi:hypothetical protein
MWSLPTRGRPESLKRFINCYKDTNASSTVYVRVDDDDVSLNDYMQVKLPDTFELIVGPRIGLKSSMEEMFHKYPNEPWYGLAADDLIPKTQYWDQLLVNEAGLKRIAYPNDMGKDPTLPTHPVIGGNLVRAVGWFGHPDCYHFYLDNAWKFIGERLENIVRLEDVVVEHLHYSFKKSSKDQTYLDQKPNMQTDGEAFNKWIVEHGNSLIANLQKLGF